MNWKLLAIPTALGLVYSGVVERVRLDCDRQIARVPATSNFRVRILHVSDLHMADKPFRQWRAARWARRLRALPFDVVVFSGDLIDNEQGIGRGADFLKTIAAGRPVFAVLGNHDYHHYAVWENILNIHTLRDWGLVSGIPVDNNVAEIERAYRMAGVELLHNRGRLFEVNGATLWIAGVDDLMMGAPNINRAVTDAPAEVPRLLISHSPDLFPWAEMAGFDLVLSGHTHGGQIRLPFVGPVVTRTHNRSLAAGLVQNHRATLHVSRGLGETVPLRFRCPAQATLVDWVGAGSHP